VIIIPSPILVTSAARVVPVLAGLAAPSSPRQAAQQFEQFRLPVFQRFQPRFGRIPLLAGEVREVVLQILQGGVETA